MLPLTIGEVSEQIDRLATNFPRSKGAVPLPKLAELWRDELRGISPDALRYAIKAIIQEDGFFPKIARIRAAAKGYYQSNPQRGVEADPLWCRGCQSKSRWEARWRPRLNEFAHQVRDVQGRLGLETFERYQCECSAPSQWRADASDDPWMTEGAR